MQRQAHPTNRRATYVELTGTGAVLARGALPEGVAEVSTLFDTLPEEDQRSLLRLVEALRTELHRRGSQA